MKIGKDKETNEKVAIKFVKIISNRDRNAVPKAVFREMVIIPLILTLNLN